MKFAKEGLVPIITASVIIGVLIALIMLFKLLWLYPVAVLLAAVEVLIISFFRDPERTTPDEPDAVIAPADGTIILIRALPTDDFIHEPALQISIFMSVFNVHVNRIPVSGTVRLLEYKKGRFFSANKDQAPAENEQMIIGIERPGFKLKFKQIAGLIARRVICYLELNQTVTAGRRFGMIKFGSRLDVIVPEHSFQICVGLGDRVKAGSTILGKIIKT